MPDDPKKYAYTSNTGQATKPRTRERDLSDEDLRAEISREAGGDEFQREWLRRCRAEAKRRGMKL